MDPNCLQAPTLNDIIFRQRKVEEKIVYFRYLSAYKILLMYMTKENLLWSNEFNLEIHKYETVNQ